MPRPQTCHPPRPRSAYPIYAVPKPPDLRSSSSNLSIFACNARQECEVAQLSIFGCDARQECGVAQLGGLRAAGLTFFETTYLETMSSY
jgi:hypothetical protein